MSRFRPLHSLLAVGACVLALGAATAQAQQYNDPQPYGQSPAYGNYDQAPGRVARLAYLSGVVQFAPAGENDWGSVEINRPLVVGDRLLTGDAGRAVLELGDASVRIDHASAFDFLNLAQDNVQIELSQGTLNLAVRQLDQGANFEVDTPTVAFVATTPGIYRIDDNPDGVGSMVTVFQGSGTVYGENGASREVVAGTSYRFNDSALASVDVTGLPGSDDFDRFCEARDASYARYVQQPRYVPSDMVGGDDLYQYGRWDDAPGYGSVWYPNSVPVGWAPYRYGHWAWIEPWGWTWVGDEPWGFAPFHYGRWVYVGSRWGWMPGPVHVRPVYAPALVAFIGGSGFSLSISLGGGPVGWFPLGPRDVYVPWFHASRSYFTNVNITNIRNVYVNRTVINNFYGDYQAGRAPRYDRNHYAYRNMAGAVTAVPRNVFVGARPVHPAVLRLDRSQLARAEVAVRPAVNPDRASLGLRGPSPRPAVLRGRDPFTRPVVARQQPAPRPVPFAERERVIARQHGQPLTPAQTRNLRQVTPVQAVREPRVRLVPGPAAGNAGFRDTVHPIPARRQPAQPAVPPTGRSSPARPGFDRTITPIPARRQPAQPAVPPAGRSSPARPGFDRTITPIPARRQPVQPAVPPGGRSSPARPGSDRTVSPVPADRQPRPLRSGELPSARFHQPAPPATLPSAPMLRPADRNPPAAPAERRLPVVRAIERAPQQPTFNRVPDAPRQADMRAQEQARLRQMEQRQQQEQAPQRMQVQQIEQQRAREEPMQQQRPTRFQAPQQGSTVPHAPEYRAPEYRPPEYRAPPQQRATPAPERREPSRKRPPPSSDEPIR